MNTYKYVYDLLMLVCLITFIFSCGSQLSSLSSENQDLFVKEVDNLSLIYVGANSKNTDTLKYCLSSEEKCEINSEADFVKKSDTMSIFKISNPDRLSFLSLKSFDSDGTLIYSRDLQFIKKTKGNGSGLWNALLISGDTSINAFDNAVSKMSSILSSRGNIKEPKKMLARSGSNRASVNSIERTLSQDSDQADSCFIFMTSHGSQGLGFYLNVTNTQYLTPTKMSDMLERNCKDKPTILLVSACYSGLFSDTQALRKDNIAILTAAASNRTSFGCGVENEYTYWDTCLVDNYEKSKTINDLSANILSCIKQKELYGSSQFSNPQTFIGSKMENFVLP